MSELRQIHDLIVSLNQGLTLAETLEAVVNGIVQSIGFRIAVINSIRPDGSFEVTAVAGHDEARRELMGQQIEAHQFDEELARSDQWGTLHFVPHDRLPADAYLGWVPEMEIVDVPDAWHPLDALFVPLTSPAGDLIGMLSVDNPHDGRRPGPVQREMLAMFAVQAGVAIDNARLTERLQANEQLFRLAFEGAGTGMALVDLSPSRLGVVLRTNDALAQLLQRSAVDLVDGEWSDLLHADDRPHDSGLLQAFSDHSHSDVSHDEQRFLRPSGEVVWGSVATSIVRRDDGSPLWAVRQVADITQHHQAREELRRQANHDPLTGLLNRSGIDAGLAELVKKVDDEHPAAVLFCDLDGFKQVNDRFGHATGDRVLSILAQRLLAQVRRDDLVGRLGGDEFLILCRDLDREQVDELALRLRRTTAEQVLVDGLASRVTVSVGIVMLGPDADPEALVRLADAAMYRAKLAGRDTHEFYDQDPVRGTA
ncbi:MAG: diguanylate cyclase domain-containing protein [Nocardioidaceae bacterium]